MNFVRELNGEQAARVVEDWDYPRVVGTDEVVHSRWFSFGESVVWWLNRNVHHTDRELALHICSDPNSRGRVYARKLLYAIDVVAELMGAERLVTWLEPGAPVAYYLARMGWQVLPDRVADGLVAWGRELGGSEHGWRW